MDIDIGIAVAGLVVGFMVGLTGMGGGALMTPLLVLVFKVNPLAAVSSDLVASMIMKPVGGGVHLRHGEVNRDIVKWLCLGSVPAALAGVVVLKSLGDSETVEDTLSVILGIALLTAALAMLAKSRLQRGRDQVDGAIIARPLLTLAIGGLGGLIVGMTSVGSGSLMMVLLLALYPRLSAKQLVGTDLVQAVPLVAAAAVGHMFLGEVQLGITGSLLIGALPGVYVGARYSSVAPNHVIRPVLVVVLASSGLKLLGVSTTVVAIFAALAACAFVAWARVQRSRWPQAGAGDTDLTQLRPREEPAGSTLP